MSDSRITSVNVSQDPNSARWSRSTSRPQSRLQPPPDSLQGKWLPALLVGFFFLTFWNPPSIPFPDPKWYIPLGLAMAAFAIEGRRFEVKASRIFWIVYSLGLLGAVLSLWRAPNFDQALWNTMGFGISFLSFALFIPILATRRTRRLFLGIVVGSAILWSLEIQRLVATYGTLVWGSFAETGSNKNHIGFGMALATTALFYLAVFWRPKDVKHRLLAGMLRLLAGALAVFIAYSLSLIYTRSGLLTTATGILTVAAVLVIKSGRLTAGMLQASAFLTVLVTLIILLLPFVLETSPEWLDISSEIQMEGMQAFDDRQRLIRKGITLIKENPLLGVGLGGSRPGFVAEEIFNIALIHNTYLAEWAERGVLGLLANIILIWYYLSFTRRHFFNLPLHDQVWLVLFIPFFIEMGMKDLGTIAVMMLAILAAIAYYQVAMDRNLQNGAMC